MCTAIQWNGLFGRNLDLWCAYGESVVITPRRYPFRFRCGEEMQNHFAMIGMAHPADGYPLYYEAVNEKGLAMAGLHFPEYAYYTAPGSGDGKTELAPWELIPWMLGRFASVQEIRRADGTFVVTDLPFRGDLPNTPLHWIIADREECLVLEATAEGCTLTENPSGVLTNSPPIACQLERLRAYDCRPREKGAGLPGDWSSSSRFVKAAYLRANAMHAETAEENVSRFFHMLDAVAMPAGAVIVPYQGKDTPEITVYACCMDLAGGMYYYKTHENSRITAVELHGSKTDGTELVIYPMETKTDFRYLNGRREEEV